MPETLDIAAFLRQNLTCLPAPSVPEILLYRAHPGSGLSRLIGRDPGAPPYWAYHWAGGAVLARHVLDRPEIVAGKRVLDLGSGSGVVAIAAAQSGARSVTAVDVDPVAAAAAEINAKANGVAIAVLCQDLLDGPVPDVDLILVGDLFYDEALAKQVLAFLQRCRQAHVDALIGDPGRLPLPVEAHERIAGHAVADFGDALGNAGRPAGVYRLRTEAGENPD